MQDGGQFVEAVGAASAADGQWHHTAAVYDRQAQTLTLYLDGKPDRATQSIAGIGASGGTSPLTLGQFGGGFPFDGEIDEISIHRAALASTDLSFSAEFAPKPPVKLVQTGRYTTTPCDWGQFVRMMALRTTTALLDGTITARSKPRTMNSKPLRRCSRSYSALASTRPPCRCGLPRLARVVFTLATTATAERSPRLADVELTAVLP